MSTGCYSRIDLNRSITYQRGQCPDQLWQHRGLMWHVQRRCSQRSEENDGKVSASSRRGSEVSTPSHVRSLAKGTNVFENTGDKQYLVSPCRTWKVVLTWLAMGGGQDTAKRSRLTEETEGLPLSFRKINMYTEVHELEVHRTRGWEKKERGSTLLTVKTWAQKYHHIPPEAPPCTPPLSHYPPKSNTDPEVTAWIHSFCLVLWFIHMESHTMFYLVFGIFYSTITFTKVILNVACCCPHSLSLLYNIPLQEDATIYVLILLSMGSLQLGAI